MVIELGVSKNGRFDSPDSDETTEIIERPAGGESIIYCNGKRHGEKSKTISSVIVNKVLEKISESFRDSTAIKSVSDQIFREYAGDLCGDLIIISADFDSGTIVVSRSTNCPVYYYQRGIINAWQTPAEQIGAVKGLHPSVTEIPIEPGTVIIMLSEGILNAGHGTNEDGEIEDLLYNLAEDSAEMTADRMAEYFVKRATVLDQNEPQDDMTAIVMKVCSDSPEYTPRRIFLTCPVPKYQSIFD